MKRFLPVMLALPLAACSAGGDFQLPSISSLSSVFAPASPSTQDLSGSIKPVARSAADDLSSMTVTSLMDGSRKTYTVRPYGNGIRVRESNGCVWTRSDDWFSPSDSWANCGDSKNWHTARAKVRELDSLYPLKVGSVGRYERRAVSSSGRSYTRETRCEVTNAVDVLRPGQAATPAYVVVCKDTRRTRTTWFAPGEGPIAYREVHRRNGVEVAWLRAD
ncbi:hypothetical protein HBA54_27920 [Pelagibius litoralis]|uniref:Lipoprotein n=1 Tax=Pelagibius litoralis TaxID=374515 RepID=A0A967KIL7_9PROT|nr:hypothetical protein [Pelagibius litoralis]NIA72421.1 hypothetical protein [Pelagibius litoralis]